jgi:hypothetical protein
MKNINEVREQACLILADLRSGALTGKDAKEMVNCIGKVISTVTVEIKYGELCASAPGTNIPFMEYDK